MAEEEILRKKYMEFQMLQQQMEEISNHAEMLNQQNLELDISINAIKELGKTKLETDLLTPIANGIFIKSSLKDNQKMVVNVGSNTTVEKTVLEVVELLEEQKKDLSERIIEVNNLLGQMNEQAMKIYQEVENVQQTEE